MVALSLQRRSLPRRLTGLLVKRKVCSASNGPRVTLAGRESGQVRGIPSSPITFLVTVPGSRWLLVRVE